MALDIVREMLLIVARLKCVRKYIAWPAGLNVLGEGKLVVLICRSSAALFSPPVKPPGPELHDESSNPLFCQPSPSWQSKLYFQTWVTGKIWLNWAEAVARGPMRASTAVANNDSPHIPALRFILSPE